MQQDFPQENQRNGSHFAKQYNKRKNQIIQPMELMIDPFK